MSTETTSCDAGASFIIAKKEMIAEPKSTWDQCCEKSIKMANRVGMFRQGISDCINSEKDCEKDSSIHLCVSVA
jgi:hypothetical protein